MPAIRRIPIDRVGTKKIDREQEEPAVGFSLQILTLVNTPWFFCCRVCCRTTLPQTTKYIPYPYTIQTDARCAKFIDSSLDIFVLHRFCFAAFIRIRKVAFQRKSKNSCHSRIFAKCLFIGSSESRVVKWKSSEDFDCLLKSTAITAKMSGINSRNQKMEQQVNPTLQFGRSFLDFTKPIIFDNVNLWCTSVPFKFV